MTATHLHGNILALEVTGPMRASKRDLGLALAILMELLNASESFSESRAARELVSLPGDAGLTLIFLGDPSSTLRCALELWEMLREVPLMSVSMALHAGEIEMDGDRPSGGSGLEEVRRLLETAEPRKISISEELADSLRPEQLMAMEAERRSPTRSAAAQRVVILGSHEEGIAETLRKALSEDGHEVVLDQRNGGGLSWAKSVEGQIRSADAIVAVIGTSDELLQFELEIALDERRRRGAPKVIPVWLREVSAHSGVLSNLSRSVSSAVWRGPEDSRRILDEVRAALDRGQAEVDAERLDTTGEAVAGNSEFYIWRRADEELEQALIDRESIVLVKGPRQIGKTSLLGRGIAMCDGHGWRCAATDFQMLSSRQLESESSFYRVAVTTLCRQLGFEYDFDLEWLDSLAPIYNMDGFMRDLLMGSDEPVVWFMDDADRLFGTTYATDFFALVRSWHNARATDPNGPWDRLTVVIGYATEVHLFIKDLNKSPFNVGQPVLLPMFSLEETSELNRRFGSPVADPGKVSELQRLLGGQPFLTRRALEIVASGRMAVDELLADADREDGPFGDHLKRILVSVTQLPPVWDALIQSLSLPELPDSEGLHRLVAANILVRQPDGRFALRCELYRRFFDRYAHPERG